MSASITPIRAGNGVPKAVRGLYEKVPNSGVWWIRYADASGRIRREKAGTRAAATNLYRLRKAAVLQGQKLPEFRKRVTFEELCDDALEHCKAENTSKVTRDFELKLGRIRPAFGSRLATEMTKREIVRWLSTEAKEREWAASTRNRWQAAFSLIFRVGVENERIERNPAAGIRRVTENNARVRFLSGEEEGALRRVILNRFPEFIHQLDLSLHTGMRAGEQFGMLWSQVDFERRILTLPKTKNGTVRHIPLNSVAMQALWQLRQGQSASSLSVFPSQKIAGASLQSARGWFRSALREAGIDEYSWHCNRHTFASRLVMAGVDIRTVGELLGHKSLSMVLRYSHLAPAHNAAAVDRLVAGFETATDTKTDTVALAS